MDIEGIKSVATAIRCISMDAVQRARSGHPGSAMGCAELGALVFGEILNHYPRDPAWINRDRFVLSAGHACVLLFALLHLSGYEISLDDLKRFRRLSSKATGHPELGVTPGVEITTGPLGQGIANAVGMAIAERMLAARFNTKREIFDYRTYAMVGDGDIMEGVSYEAASLAGHLALGKLIVFYDSNRITIEGSTELCFTEDVRKRFQAFNWQVFEGSAYDLPRIMRFLGSAKKETRKPTLLIMKSVIGKGSANLAGSHEVHGSPLGEQEVKASKKAMGVPEDSEFYIPARASAYMTEQMKKWEARHAQWQEIFRLWQIENPEKQSELEKALGSGSTTVSVHTPLYTGRTEGLKLPAFQKGAEIATRIASGQILEALANQLPELVGGSADLSHSTATHMEALGRFDSMNPRGRSIYFGIREHAMAAIANGMAVGRFFRVFCSTYLVFSDYMRPSIRLAAMMKLPTIYVFTHDSVFLGEDGPTHQPVEQLASLRAVPNLLVLRPGDAEETAAAWKMAISREDGPTALILSRQPLRIYEKADANWEETLRHGGYTVSDSKGQPKIVIIATGSEVNLALETKRLLGSEDVRVVSMMCRELFNKAPSAIQEKLVPTEARRIVLEAGVPQGWEGIAGKSGRIFCVETFGQSATMKELQEFFQFEPHRICKKVREVSVDEGQS